jgi:hypothetical protein
MSREDEEHTAFLIVDGLFCYVSMPYGIKNALPTFVRAMHKTFGDLIRDLIEVYVDVIIVKIKSCASLLDNLAKVFDRLQTTCTKLNPVKCVFGVTMGKLLGFLVSYRGIEANLEKIRTIEAMRPPACIMVVQKLMGFLAALSRFISRLDEQALMFFKLLCKSGPFVWTDEAEEVFQELKRYLKSPPVMVAPKSRDPLLLYVAATAEAVSMVLIVERPEPPQPQETKEAYANGSGSQDPQPVGSPRVRGIARSQLPEASLAPKSQGITNSITAPRHPEAFSDLGSHEPSGSEPMEVYKLDPPGRGHTV